MSRPTSTAAIQRRTVRTLLLAQVFSALGNGSTIALGSILAVDLSGTESLAGVATTGMSLGTAVAAIPLAQLATARGRRASLTRALGAAAVGTLFIVAAVLARQFLFLLAGALLVGFGTAANLQARFAVTDLAAPERRGRDLSLVVWAITVGAVLGPNLIRPGAVLAGWLGIPAEAGPFVISAAGLLLGAGLIQGFLRPDPLLTRRALDGVAAPVDGRRAGSWREGLRIVGRHDSARAAVLGIVAAQVVMVAVMSMTPLHMQHEGDGIDPTSMITLIGFTISLHILGMYGFSPVMGWLADRVGAHRVLVLGLALLLLACALTGLFAHDLTVVTVGLVVLGLAWSAATIAGSTQLVEALEPAERVPAQGFSDAAMSLAGAVGGALSGVVMGALDYTGLAAASAVVVVLATVGVMRRGGQPARPRP